MINKIQLSIIVLFIFMMHSSVSAATSKFRQLNINSLAIENNNNITVAALSDNTVSQQVSSSSSPQATELNSDSQVTESRGGYIHGSLGVSGEYTDNLYNTDIDKQENFLTEISPTVWIAMPRRAMVPIHIASHNTSAGGLQYTQPWNNFFNKYQLYLSGGLVFKNYSENSDLNETAIDLEGMFQYNPTSTLTLQAVDKYTRNQDQFDLSNATEDNQRVYDSNLFTAGADWQFSPKFSAKLDYNNFNLMYEDDINDFLDRTDNGFDIYGYYDYSPKTNFFLQYRYIMASYDSDSIRDNDNQYLYGGINWQYSVKTTLMAKAGYQKVEYDNDEYANIFGLNNTDFSGDSDNFAFELQMNWRVTVKTSLILDAAYSTEQSDSTLSLNKKVFSTRLGYEQRFTDRFRGSINFIYENSDYHQFAEFDDISREDDRYYIKPELQYAFRKWLTGAISYSYDNRDSSRDLLDYDTNTFRLGLNASF